VNTPATTPAYTRHCFLSEITAYSAWLYFRFWLSYRHVDELMLAHRMIVTDEAIHKWWRKCGQSYANERRRQCPRPSAKWHLDEVFLTIKGERHYL